MRAIAAAVPSLSRLLTAVERSPERDIVELRRGTVRIAEECALERLLQILLIQTSWRASYSPLSV